MSRYSQGLTVKCKQPETFYMVVLLKIEHILYVSNNLQQLIFGASRLSLFAANPHILSVSKTTRLTLILFLGE